MNLQAKPIITTTVDDITNVVNFKSLSDVVEYQEESAAIAQTTAALLSNVTKVDLVSVCQSLGWKGLEGDYPKQKHMKVAILHTLIETAKRHNWHIIHETGFFYIYNGAYWVVMEDAQVKRLLKSAAINMGYVEIECRDAKFVDTLFRQAVEDGFFAERNIKKQSIINLQNGSLVLDENGAKLKPFDHRDFITHQLSFSHDIKAVNELFLRYLERVLPDEDTRRTLQQVAGYLFIKGLKLEKIFFLIWHGREWEERIF